MLRLEPLTDAVCAEYADKVLPGLKKRIEKGRTHQNNNYSLRPAAQDILLPKLKQLLISKPAELKQLNDSLRNNFTQLSGQDCPNRETIELLFHYDGVFNSSQGQENAYWLAKKIGRNTCTYCNRQYIFTVEHQDTTGRIKRLARPAFDHWYPKSDYPLLSLSLYNLIPSCTICNSSVKGKTPMDLSTHIHPYVKWDDTADFTFRASPKASETMEWELKIDRQTGTLMDQTIRDLALEEIYALHVPLEVKDIMDFSESYPEGYLNTLFDELCNNNRRGLTRTEVYRMLFGVEAIPDQFLDRPFSKLKYDLLKQIGLKF